MKAPAVFSAILATLLAAAANAGAATAPSVTLHTSTLSFKQAVAACSGALGTVTFTLGHARVASLPGVAEQVDTSSSGIDTITFANDATGKSAVAIANGHKLTVSAKNVQVKWNNQLACVMSD
jgi:type 1 fimbria pilin